ncbi:imidazolonepropionase [Occultella glacieicola]|uniref:Imidazolonepropionase n=1 Tax=Occultella glacieicola TaxID=2518684 RepID=A0ABY2E690_9MICO|nr:imidazolonepropionase [Occultella glacieicola]TDE95031.1 imidazolonepropionase [Occultella glacieicola]
MVSVLVTGITELVTNDPALGAGRLGIVRDAAIVVELGASAEAGTASDASAEAGTDTGASAEAQRGRRAVPDGVPASDDRVTWVGLAAAAPPADRVIDVGGRAVVPSFVDSHTHLAFAGDRAAEFAARMAGESYDGGGIASTVAATRGASAEALRARLAALVAEARAQGTGTIEIKSGYGLTVADELRLLRLAREVTGETTFLGAHVVPPEYVGRADDYVDLVTGPMLAECAPHARWIDVFCEPGSPHAFDGDQSRAVLLAGRAAGLGLRVHAGQLGPGPGVRLGVELGAAAVDHGTHLTREDVDALAGSTTVATLLPGVEFSTGSPYPDARALLDAGVRVALATDCNPGTSFTSSMPLCIALAVREMHMTPAEALWAATAGGALALRRDDVGRLGIGARADLTVLDASSHVHLSYRPGVPLARTLALTG